MSKINTNLVIQKLERTWGTKPCPMCGGGPWSVSDAVYQLAEFHQGNVIIGGPVVPVVPVSCTNCGHTVLVNAIITGLISNPPPANSGGVK